MECGRSLAHWTAPPERSYGSGQPRPSMGIRPYPLPFTHPGSSVLAKTHDSTARSTFYKAPARQQVPGWPQEATVGQHTVTSAGIWALILRSETVEWEHGA